MVAYAPYTPAGLNRGQKNTGTGGLGRRILQNIVRAFSIVHDAAEATAHYQRLNILSDAQLKKAGMRRQDISRVVFERTFGKL